MDVKFKTELDEASEIYLYSAINQMGGFIWRMNHDIGDGRIKSNEAIERDLITMQESLEYAVDQLRRFGLRDPRGKITEAGVKEYWIWYRAWDDYFNHVISDEDLEKVGQMLRKDHKDPCKGFRPEKLVTELLKNREING